VSGARSWRAPRPLDGPFVARTADIGPLNDVFADAFTDRYRRDGMVGVRVPHLNPLIWRYAIEDAGEGALLWRDDRGQIAGFNMVHHSGAEGWMGPLAVRPDVQGAGAGREIVLQGIALLERVGARTIGLETMPRTMDNIGFYSTLGFVPGRLTITVTLEAAADDRPASLFARLSSREKEGVLGACRALVARLQPGYDFTREITLTDDLGLGDTVLLFDGGALAGFALCHSAPLIEGRAREELRVLKLALAHERLLEPMARAVCDLARRSGTRRVAIRVQGEYLDAYRRLIALGGRVRWTDLRMALQGYPESPPVGGMMLSNWEI